MGCMSFNKGQWGLQLPESVGPPNFWTISATAFLTTFHLGKMGLIPTESKIISRNSCTGFSLHFCISNLLTLNKSHRFNSILSIWNLLQAIENLQIQISSIKVMGLQSVDSESAFSHSFS